MVTIAQCPECGADWSAGETCENHFHTLLAWELEHQLYNVHHLLVLCYHLQHPALYSPEALAGAKKMLIEFLEDDVSPQEMRKRMAQAVDSGTRKHKIKGTSESYGMYENPLQWQMHTADVTKAGIENYYDSVRVWAQSTLQNLRDSDNLN